MGFGTELWEVPLFDQRSTFENPLKLKSADNTEFSAKPQYSYKIIESRAIDIVFDNKHIGNGNEFLTNLENNILEPRIYDIVKEESRKFITDTLMSNGGSLRFEKGIEALVKAEFHNRGLELINFSSQLDFSDKVKEKIDTRNEVNTNVTVIDQQIIEQRKQNELAKLKAEENIILSKGITNEILKQQFIEKWDGKTPLYFNSPLNINDVSVYKK